MYIYMWSNVIVFDESLSSSSWLSFGMRILYEYVSSECARKVRRYNVWITFKLDCCIFTTTTTMSTDDRQRLHNMFCFCWLSLYYDFDLNICAECPHFEAWKLKYVQAKSNVSSSIKFKFKWIKKKYRNKTREKEGES